MHYSNYTITASLAGALEKEPNRVKARNAAFIQGFVLSLQKFDANFVNIGAKYFESHCGGRYRAIIDYLVQLGELEVNERYSNASHFTKSYRVPADKLRGGKRCFYLHGKKSGVKVLRDRSSYSGEIGEFLKANFGQLTVEAPENLAAHEILALNRIRCGAANISRKDPQGRVFHSLLKVPKHLRPYLRHVSGAALFEADIKSCHPWLLVSLCSDRNEAARLADLVTNSDIYSAVSQWAGVEYSPEQVRQMTRRRRYKGCQTARDVFKVDLMVWLNGARQNYFHDYFAALYPQLSAFISLKGKTMARFLQNLEASLVIDKLLPALASQNVFIVPMHDGWLSTVRNQDNITETFKAICLSTIGITPIIKYTFYDKKGFSMAHISSETNVQEVSPAHLVSNRKALLTPYDIKMRYLEGKDIPIKPETVAITEKKQPMSARELAVHRRYGRLIVNL